MEIVGLYEELKDRTEVHSSLGPALNPFTPYVNEVHKPCWPLAKRLPKMHSMYALLGTASEKAVLLPC